MHAYKSFFEIYLKKGLNVLHITLSSGITGSYNSALLAANELLSEYPDNQVCVIDSLSASSGYGLLVKIAKDNQNQGMSFEENKAFIEDYRHNIHHWFFTSDLTYLIRGGRVSKAAGFVGTALHLCPLLRVSDTGHLETMDKIRGKKKTIKVLVEKMETYAIDGLKYDGEVYIANSDCLNDALEVKKEILERFVNVKEVKIYSIGTVIGSHTGPGTIVLLFKGSKREKKNA